MMSTGFLQTGSEISTHFRCDHCGIMIDKVSWMQCKICKEFDLCNDCANIGFARLPYMIVRHHEKLHANISKNGSITDDCMERILVEQAETHGIQSRKNRREKEFDDILKKKNIQNDIDMAVVMDKLKEMTHESISSSLSKEDNLSTLSSLIVEYHSKANQRNIHILSLDGGGVRGYMPIKILGDFITQKYLPNIEQINSRNPEHKQIFPEAQLKFTEHFDYFVGTSTGGLIAFCLAIDYNILDMEEIYSESQKYFKKNWTGPLICSKYNPSVIHAKIDEIIESIQLPDGKYLSAKHATLRDIRNFLNPGNIIDDEKAATASLTHGNFLEFVDVNNFTEDFNDSIGGSKLRSVKREKVLLITAYNTTQNSITIFNTSYAPHWGYLIADVLKATMAAPTYFPPHEVYKGVQNNGYFMPGNKSELFIDGGVFANDPELAALWAIRMQWRKPTNYHLLSIGTCCYTSQLSSSTWGGYFGWIFNDGILVNTLMDATRSFTEIIASNLSKFNNMRRMKLNYKLTKALALDDPEFVKIFDDEWQYLKNKQDFKTFVYFYDNYITEQD